jgi:F-type H+-transporting ATPase subunit delta
MSGKLTTIARPYAEAAFDYALSKKALAEWEAFLHAAATVAKDPAMAVMLENPQINIKQRRELFCDILASLLDAEKKNFIFLLAENRRLPVLPDIAELFSQYRAAREKTISVEIISAAELDEPTQKKFAAALTERLKQQVTLECKIDADLLAGAIIRAGDLVLDGSVRGKLNRLVESL